MSCEICIKNECTESGCFEEIRCPSCHKCQDHHDKEEDVGY
jgi:hypothetical protein